MSSRKCSVGIGVFAFAISCVCSKTFAEEWAPAPRMNVPRQYFGAAVDESGDIWAFGGFDRTGGCCCGTGSILESVEVLRFDGISYAAQWELTPIVMPTPRLSHSVVIIGGFVYVLGGFDELGVPLPLSQVDRYDILSDTWNSIAVPPLNEPTNFGEAVTDPLGRIWYMGGRSELGWDGVVATVEIFDPALLELGWQPGPGLNQPRGHFASVVDLQGRIYAIDGATDGGVHVPTVERIDPCGPNLWSVLPESPPGPTTIEDDAVLGADGHIYVVGGWKAHTWIDRVARLNPDGGTWETWSSLAQARNAHRVVLGRDDSIYAIGGSVSGCNSTTSVEKLYTGPRIFSDCNGNNFHDAADINCGTSADDDESGIPDECENEPPTCDTGAPYAGECEGMTTDIMLDATGSSDPDDDPLGFLWSTDCPDGFFDDPASVAPTLSVDTSDGCDVTCNGSLTVDDGNGGSSECSTTVTISDTTPPVVTCSATPLSEHRMLIEYDAWDACGQVTGSAVIETQCCPLPVSNGQVVKVECRNHEECKLDVDFDRGTFKIKTDEAALVVTATDECGNEATCTVELCAAGEDD